MKKRINVNARKEAQEFVEGTLNFGEYEISEAGNVITAHGNAHRDLPSRILSSTVWRVQISLLFCFCLYVPSLLGQISADIPLNQKIGAKFNFTYYFDSRDYNTFNIFTGVKHLPGGLEYWGFTDIHAAQSDATHRFDFTRYFMEYRLIYTIHPEWVNGLKGYELEAEFDDSDGSGNALLRFGVTYKHSIPLPWQTHGGLRWRIHPYESDGNGYQASLLYSLPLTAKVKITGFADYNVVENAENRWVIEPQLTWKLNGYLNIRLEFRYNGFENATKNLDGSGIALGFGFLS